MYSSSELGITRAQFKDEELIVTLNDGRIIVYPLRGMAWITGATPAQQQDFTVTEWEVYWNQLDDGITLEHLLSPKPRVDFTVERLPNWKAFYGVLAKYRSESEVAGDRTRRERIQVPELV